MRSTDATERLGWGLLIATYAAALVALGIFLSSATLDSGLPFALNDIQPGLCAVAVWAGALALTFAVSTRAGIRALPSATLALAAPFVDLTLDLTCNAAHQVC